MSDTDPPQQSHAEPSLLDCSAKNACRGGGKFFADAFGSRRPLTLGNVFVSRSQTIQFIAAKDRRISHCAARGTGSNLRSIPDSTLTTYAALSTSVAYLRKRLADIGRHDLLLAAENGEISTYCAAEAAGLITRKAVTGNGSPNQAKKRAWAVMKVEERAAPLAPKPEPQPVAPAPAQPKFSQETRDTIARLVELGRADLVLAVTERRISPFQAARIADRGTSVSGKGSSSSRSHSTKAERRDVSQNVTQADTKRVTKAERRADREQEPAKIKPARLDVRALIG